MTRKAGLFDLLTSADLTLDFEELGQDMRCIWIYPGQVKLCRLLKLKTFSVKLKEEQPTISEQSTISVLYNLLMPKKIKPCR